MTVVRLSLFERLQTDIHDTSSYLKNPCLLGFDLQLVLNLYQRPELREIVFDDELVIVELDGGVLPRH